MRYKLTALVLCSLALLLSCGHQREVLPRSEGLTLLFDIEPDPAHPGVAPDAAAVVSALDQRLDPSGTGRFAVKTITPKRIEVWFYFPKACQDAYREMQKRRDAIPSPVPSQDELNKILALSDEKQAPAINALVPLTDPRNPRIKDYAEAFQKLRSIKPEEIPYPEEVRQHVLSRGVLEFRITVAPDEVTDGMMAAVETLKTKGPAEPVKASGLTARWYRIEPERLANFEGPRYVTGVHSGTSYVLCYDDPSRCLIHKGPEWRVTAGSPYTDPSSGRVMLPFRLDAVGAKQMSELTGNNRHRAMCILLDDVALSAPTIQSRISDAATITFSHDGSPKKQQREAEDMSRILSALPVPARLKPVPDKLP